MSEFTPKYDVKATGHVTATFQGAATPAHIANVVEWIKQQKWRGVLQIHCVGNGGISNVIFAESPKALKEDAEAKIGS